jgi:hypothetical protein
MRRRAMKGWRDGRDLTRLERREGQRRICDYRLRGCAPPLPDPDQTGLIRSRRVDTPTLDFGPPESKPEYGQEKARRGLARAGREM